MEEKGTLEVDEIVIATVKKIFPYGAFCSLDEYPDKEGFLHISEVAAGWVKNIHNFLKVGQRVVGKVYRMIPEKNIIDLSVKRISESDRKRKLDEYRKERRSKKILEVAYKKMKNAKMSIERVQDELEAAYGEVYKALEEISVDGEKALEKTKITKDWKKILAEISKINIKKQKKRISGTFNIICPTPDGINAIKKAFKNVKEGELTYIGAPRYIINIEGDDYKECEKKLKTIVDTVTKSIKRSDGFCRFERFKEEDQKN